MSTATDPAAPLPPPGATALVLAGGGTKGAFEVGVIDYLVREKGVDPSIVTAASAGAILGVVLSQARGREELCAAVDDIRHDLLSMTRTDQVFGRQPWLEAFAGTRLGDTVDSFLTERARPPVPGGTPELEEPDDTPPSRAHRTWQQFTQVLEDLPVATKAFRQLKGHASSMLTLDPLEKALREGTEGDVRAVDTSRITREGLWLRMAVTALRAGEVHFIGNDGTVFGPDAVTPLGDRRATDALSGAMASSTVPMVFPPRPIGDEVYVDGGMLQNIPLEAAVALGAGAIHTVLAAPLDPPPSDEDFANMNLVGIYLRCTAEIGFKETQSRNLRVAVPDGVEHRVYAPTVDVVGPFEVQQGLMLLDMDYGWLRAEETWADLDVHEQRIITEATDRLVVARERAWYLEEHCLEKGTSLSPADETSLRALKERVASCLAIRHRFGFPEPEAATNWVHGFEHHSKEIPPDFPKL